MNFSRRYLSYFTNNKDRIDIYNTFYGEETIFFNGNIVSRKFSIFGAYHRFVVQKENTRNVVEVKISIKWPLRIGFDIFVNGNAVLLS